MVDEPRCAQKGPYQVTLEAGKAYFWCACGRSAKQPFCDGAHKATSFQPHRFVAEVLGDLQPVRLQGNGRPAVLRRHPQHSLIAVALRLWSVAMRLASRHATRADAARWPTAEKHQWQAAS